MSVVSPPRRVVAFVDGFNLYHAIDDLKQNHLKWLNLRVLCANYAPPPHLQLTQVYYFSAYATWKASGYKRHREYVKALRAVDVIPVMGRFKEKTRTCSSCRRTQTQHEEKETDVNIALALLLGAMKNEYDRALLISGDSDLSPAVRLIKAEAPAKEIRIVTPPGRSHSMDLVHAAGGLKHCVRMMPLHVERSLLQREVLDSRGQLIATRPVEYAPPS